MTVEQKRKRRPSIKQTDAPSVPLEQALRIPRAIVDNYAGKPTTPLHVAAALNLQPSSGQFKQLCGAAIAYGLTEGGYHAEVIKITELGHRAVRDDLAAWREAIMKPRVFRDFLLRYNGSPLPNEKSAHNVLEDLGVPRERAADVYTLLIDSAEKLGLLKSIKDKRYVDLSGLDAEPVFPTGVEAQADDAPETGVTEQPLLSSSLVRSEAATAASDLRKKRVFIAHGKNTSFIEPVKKLLRFGEMEAVVATERHTVSQPVPEKVLADMRSCGAAIIHVETERVIVDSEGQEHVMINGNVLIEIGAAMALYGKRFVLLVQEGIHLPSNLQGLYEVRYKGEALDGDATIRLLEAINDIKNHPLPDYTDRVRAG